MPLASEISYPYKRANYEQCFLNEILRNNAYL